MVLTRRGHGGRFCNECSWLLRRGGRFFPLNNRRMGLLALFQLGNSYR